MLEILDYKSEIFDKYANDSLVSDAFDMKNGSTSISQSKKKAIALEQDRLAKKRRPKRKKSPLIITLKLIVMNPLMILLHLIWKQLD